MENKKYKLKIGTLTPIHIGSGFFLQHNTDYFTFKENEDDDNNSMIGVVDDRKILQIIGEDHLSDWVNSIERERDIKEVIQKLAPNSKPESYTKRVITNFYTKRLDRGNTLKECLHDGMGRPYIPGSSIKGAIRTAIFASIMSKINLSHIEEFSQLRSYEKQCLGSDPNSDIFRFLQIGDAIFVKNCEVATMLVNLNIRSKESLRDTSKKQLIEAIDQEMEAHTTLKLNVNYNIFCHNRDSNIKQIPKEMESVEKLFSTINSHTKKLVQEEISLWSKISKEKNDADNYIKNLKDILSQIISCKENECVLRLGHTSGWRFTTGAWTEALHNFDSIIPLRARPNNNYYEEYIFPKTRRIDDEDFILGFVKLSVNKLENRVNE